MSKAHGLAPPGASEGGRGERAGWRAGGGRGGGRARRAAEPGARCFQAEAGIRDVAGTGVQTCALPILPTHSSTRPPPSVLSSPAGCSAWRRSAQIGRASGRERGENSGGGGVFKKK